jgi:hypothetical protein
VEAYPLEVVDPQRMEEEDQMVVEVQKVAVVETQVEAVACVHQAFSSGEVAFFVLVQVVVVGWVVCSSVGSFVKVVEECLMKVEVEWCQL